MNNQNAEAICKVKDVIERLFKITLPKDDDVLQSPLTGSRIGLSSVDMTYLFFEIEKEFGIRINTDLILNYEFNTINGIAEVINGSTV